MMDKPECKNSMSGKHEWMKLYGKNADKPEQCKFCHILKIDHTAMIAKGEGKDNG